jgi:hypothetical protein
MITFHTPATTAAYSQLLGLIPLVPEVKFVKSIVIDSAGGKVGATPLSFLHPVKNPGVRASIRTTEKIFFIG